MEGSKAKLYHETLLEGLPRPVSPLGPKPREMQARWAEAARLSGLMARVRPFCFLRLGDMELTYLLAHQDGAFDRVPHGDGHADGTQAYGNPGLTHRHAVRMWTAFGRAEYVDFHERLWPNSVLLPRLRLDRAAELERNPDAETSYILLTWMEGWFREYCRGRRVGFAGAEASLLEALLRREEYCRLAADYWAGDALAAFHQVRNNGRDIDGNLDVIKEDLRRFIVDSRLDTLFLAMGGGAKILCYELSRDLGICAVDFGAMLRGLTCCASFGAEPARAFHTPFFVRVPFPLFMDAVVEAFSGRPPEWILAKAHAQLLFELQAKEAGWTHAVWEDDYCAENLGRFRDAYREYLARYRSLIRLSSAARRERANFLHYCGSRGLTWESRAFYGAFRVKCAARRVCTWVREGASRCLKNVGRALETSRKTV